MMSCVSCRVTVLSVDYGNERVYTSRHSYLLSPVALITWALLFPSWLSLVWLLASWLIFSLIAERRHRLSVAPFLITYASVRPSSRIISFINLEPLPSATLQIGNRLELIVMIAEFRIYFGYFFLLAVRATCSRKGSDFKSKKSIKLATIQTSTIYKRRGLAESSGMLGYCWQIGCVDAHFGFLRHPLAYFKLHRI